MNETIEKKETLCRLDGGIHWCVKCCIGSRANCLLLGQLSDGTQGCLNHQTDLKKGNVTQDPICREINCLTIYDVDPEQKEMIIKEISLLPPGQIDVEKIIKKIQKGGETV